MPPDKRQKLVIKLLYVTIK